jgi:hypothetical protein
MTLDAQGSSDLKTGRRRTAFKAAAARELGDRCCDATMSPVVTCIPHSTFPSARLSGTTRARSQLYGQHARGRGQLHHWIRAGGDRARIRAPKQSSFSAVAIRRPVYRRIVIAICQNIDWPSKRLGDLPISLLTSVKCNGHCEAQRNS